MNGGVGNNLGGNGGDGIAIFSTEVFSGNGSTMLSGMLDRLKAIYGGTSTQQSMITSDKVDDILNQALLTTPTVSDWTNESLKAAINKAVFNI